uniref:DUF4408 domain-containing protein n=1 Tax=Ananas comosus var. bracteatus TaxID=296719 RepID=A0A6V7QSJ3_ANACO
MVEDARRWIWAWVSGWLTPTGLFVLLNLVIGTIAVTNRAHRHRDRPAAAAAEGGARPLSRTSSAFVLERLRSFGLYRFRSGDFPLDYIPSSAAEHAAEPGPDRIVENLSEVEEERHHFGRSRSESRVPASAAEVEGAGRMKKSASASSAFAKFEEERVVRRRAAVEEEEEEVNARADDFINRFRQQLKLQRLNSLLNYKEMLNRGS